jgi:magnesium transporter
VIVDSAVYRQGKRLPLTTDPSDIGDVLDAINEPGDFVWVGLYEPTAHEMELIALTLGLHPLAVEDAVRAHQRPKLERFSDNRLFLVLKTLWYVDEDDAVETGEIALFVGPSYVVTVRHGSGQDLTEVRTRLEDSSEVLGHGPFAVVHSVADAVVDNYELVAAELERDVDEIEISVFSPERTNDSARIYHLKREVAEFRRAVMPLRDPLSKFALRQIDGMPPEGAAFFRDVVDHAVRVTEQVESLDSLLTSAFDAHLARLSIQQNDDMRKISAWVAIAAVPTAVAGIYGMNFDDMPELTWKYGYPAILLLMAVVCVGLYRAFKRSGWL